MNNTAIVVAIICAVLASNGVWSIVAAYIKKRKPKEVRKEELTQAQTAREVSLARQAQEYAQKIEEDAEQSRRTAAAAWEQLEAIQRRMRLINTELDETVRRFEAAIAWMDRVITYIFERNTTIDGVRTYIEESPPPHKVPLDR